MRWRSPYTFDITMKGTSADEMNGNNFWKFNFKIIFFISAWWEYFNSEKLIFFFSVEQKGILIVYAETFSFQVFYG